MLSRRQHRRRPMSPVLATVARGPAEVVTTPEEPPEPPVLPEQDPAPRRGPSGPTTAGAVKEESEGRGSIALLSSHLTACFASLAM